VHAGIRECVLQFVKAGKSFAKDDALEAPVEQDLDHQDAPQYGPCHGIEAIKKVAGGAGPGPHIAGIEFTQQRLELAERGQGFLSPGDD